MFLSPHDVDLLSGLPCLCAKLSPLGTPLGTPLRGSLRVPPTKEEQMVVRAQQTGHPKLVLDSDHALVPGLDPGPDLGLGLCCHHLEVSSGLSKHPETGLVLELLLWCHHLPPCRPLIQCQVF